VRWRASAAAFAAALAPVTLVALPSAAEQELGPLLVSGEAQVGGRGVWGDTDSAKFEEYREVAEGAFGSLRFLIEDSERRYYLEGWLDDMAEEDQQYRFRGGRYGRWGIRGFYSEIPHVFSNQAVSPFGRDGSILSLPGAWDFGLLPADPPNPNTNPWGQQVSGFSLPGPLEFRTLEGSGELFVRPTSEVDLSAGYRILDRDGSRAWGLGFGTAGTNYANVAAPIKERIHEARADAQYVRSSWNLGLSYIGSFFENDFDSFSVANARNDVAATGSTNVGRVALAPDNSAHLVSLSGAGLLPTSFPARLAANFAWGLHLQDDDFLPYTSNSAVQADPANAGLLDLPQNSLDGQVQTILGNVVFTARPLSSLNLKARYHIYDYNNQTDELSFSAEVPNDRQAGAQVNPGTTSIAHSYRRQDALVEAAWKPWKAPVTATLGFLWEHWNRDKEREVRNSDQYGPTARVDWRAARWARLRASYAFAARRGSDYDALPSALAGLRKYSQADFLRHRFELQTQLDPVDAFSLTLSSGFSLSNYDDSAQGVTDDDRWNVGVDASFQPFDWVGLWANYAYDTIWALQKQGGGTWESRTYDTAHNGGVGADFNLVPDLLDLELSYFVQLAHARTSGDGTALDLPTIKDTLQAATVGVSVQPLDYLGFRLRYRWERYDRDNFHEDFPISDTQGDIYLQNRIADYNAHIASISAVLSF